MWFLIVCGLAVGDKPYYNCVNVLPAPVQYAECLHHLKIINNPNAYCTETESK